jgi:hypothetical protein
MHTWIWALLGLFGAFGLTAVLSPRFFTVVATKSSTWIDVNKALAKLDKQVDIDRYVLPHSRLLGVAVITAVALFGVFLVRR